MKGKLIIISGPSGAGKTSIVKYLLAKNSHLTFSISACSRSRRKDEKEGQEYYFLSAEEFKQEIKNNSFLEWEEVYKNQYYGTLQTEINRIWKSEKHVLFDVDVAGALNIKSKFPKKTLTIFIMPPSLKTLKSRLHHRDSESNESLLIRLNKAKSEIKEAKKFDKIILNQDFENSCKGTLKEVENFIKK